MSDAEVSAQGAAPAKSSAGAPAPAGTADARLAWRSWPLVDEWPRSGLLVSIVVGVSAALGGSFGDPLVGLISAGLLSISLARYLLPTAFTLDAKGVEVRFLGLPQRRPWSEVRACYPHKDGVHLSPFPKPSPLDPFRGIYVRFAGNREAVLAAVLARMAAARGAPAPARAADG